MKSIPGISSALPFYPRRPALAVRADGLGSAVLESAPGVVGYGVAAGLAGGRPAAGAADGSDQAGVTGARGHGWWWWLG